MFSALKVKDSKRGVEYWIGLTKPCVEMDVLYWFRMKQTQMYVCTLEEFILVDVVTLLYMDELKI